MTKQEAENVAYTITVLGELIKVAINNFDETKVCLSALQTALTEYENFVSKCNHNINNLV